MEREKMSLLGLAITIKGKGEGSVYVEYHRCEKCGAEYRVYMRSPQSVEGAFQELARRMGNRPEEQDLCFSCQSGVIVDQMVLPIEV